MMHFFTKEKQQNSTNIKLFKNPLDWSQEKVEEYLNVDPDTKVSQVFVENFDMASEFTKMKFRQSPGNFSSFLSGVSCAIVGSFAVWRNPEFAKNEAKIWWVLIRKVVLVYAMIVCGLVVLWPAAVAVAMLSPSSISSLFTVAPLWAFNAAQSSHKVQFNNLFVGELSAISPNLARRMRRQIEVKGVVRSPSMYSKFRSSYHFTFWTFIVNLIGVIPVIGTLITPIGQLVITSERFGWNLLNPYLTDYKGFTYTQQKQLLNRHWYRLIGFSIPFVLLSSVPFVNTYVIGYGQAGAAHLLVEMLKLEEIEDLDTASIASTDALQRRRKNRDSIPEAIVVSSRKRESVKRVSSKHDNKRESAERIKSKRKSTKRVSSKRESTKRMNTKRESIAKEIQGNSEKPSLFKSWFSW